MANVDQYLNKDNYPDPIINHASIVGGDELGLEAAITVILSNGSIEHLFSYYKDELDFTKDEFNGMTKSEALEYIAQKDKQNLQSATA